MRPNKPAQKGFKEQEQPLTTTEKPPKNPLLEVIGTKLGSFSRPCYIVGKEQTPCRVQREPEACLHDGQRGA